MNVCILGPVFTPKKFGGVEAFTEGLAKGFIENGHNCFIVTKGANHKTQKNLEIINIANSIKSYYLKRKKLNNIIESKDVKLVVSSMEYGLPIKYLKKKLPQVKFIHVLHGFPTKTNYNILKLNLLNKTFKYYKKHFDYFIANSELTKKFNEENYNITTDKVIHIATKKLYVKDSEKTSKQICFIGRLVKDKRIDLAIKAFLKADIKGSKFIIVGDGPEKENLIKITNDPRIKFTGKLPHDAAIEYFKTSELFISLNNLEPFGIVFLEAVANKCKIVCPNSGGQTEFLKQFSNEVEFVDIGNIECIATAIKKLINQDNTYQKQQVEKFLEYYSYKRVASDMIDVFK